MKNNNKLIERYISSQWGDFLELALLQMDKALAVYKKNANTTERDSDKNRKLIAPSESAASSIVVVSITTAIESFINSRAYHEKLKDFDTFEELATKLTRIQITNQQLLTAARELTVCRDAIMHGHLWLKYRVTDGISFKLQEIRSYLWSPFKSTLKRKFILNVDWKKRRTKQFHFKIIPLDVSYLDCIKALSILNIVMETAFNNANIVWRPPLYPHTRDGFSQETADALSKRYYPNNWLEYFEKQLTDDDKKKYNKTFQSI